MAKVTKVLTADEARAAFPWIVGLAHITGAEHFGDHATIVGMGRGAHAIIINGKWEGCCPTRKYAMKRVDQELAIVAKHLSPFTRY